MRSTSSIALLALLTLAGGCETEFNMAEPQAPVAIPSAGATGTGESTAGAPPLPLGGSPAPGVGTAGAPTAGMATAGVGTGVGGVGVGGAGGADAPGGDGGGAAGTGAGEGGEPARPAGAGAPATPDPAPQTCPPSSALQPGETTERIQVGTMTRSFILHVPASYDGQTPVPLVIDWHGILMNSTLQRAWSGFADLSERENFIVAFPEGTDTAFNVGICCTSSGAVDDVAFARAIADHLSEQGCIDQKRIHSVGYSMGGGMSMHLACNAADRFASIATSAFDMMPEADWPCTPSRPIALISFRSTGDPIVPYAGALNTIPPNGTPTLVTFIGAKENLAKWGGLDGCTDTPTNIGGGCEAYRQCAGGVEVELCTKPGGGHDYMDPNVAWEFLKRFPMP